MSSTPLQLGLKRALSKQGAKRSDCSPNIGDLWPAGTTMGGMQRMRKAASDVVVIGAGVAGCSAFYHLARLNRQNPGFKLILVDARPPLTLTSANGSFSYRNWFPSKAEAPMRELVTASIDELDYISKSTDNMIELNRNGYLFVTRDPKKAEEFKTQAKKLERNGGGSFRVHDEYSGLANYRMPPEAIEYDLDGSDLLMGMDNIKRVFPSLKDSNAVAALHVRRCGSMNPFKLGSYELNKATEFCPHAQIVRGEVTDIFGVGGSISGIKIAADTGESLHISTPNVVFATGPLFEKTLNLLKKRALSSFDVPIINELHMRAVMDDPLGVITQTTPLTFDSDHVGYFGLTEEERAAITADPSAARLLEEFPSGVHVRPYLSNKMMSVWTYDKHPMEAHYPVEDVLDKHYPGMCLRALTRLYPQMKPYLNDPQVRNSLTVNGGYYCKTMDNMPMIGPAPNTISGVYLQSAMSGIGLMSSGASGQLLAACVMGIEPENETLAKYADAFLPSRFEDQEYVKSLADGGTLRGQV